MLGCPRNVIQQNDMGAVIAIDHMNVGEEVRVRGSECEVVMLVPL